jgi:hypothetical protein
MEASYWRLNRDELPDYIIHFNPSKSELLLTKENLIIIFNPNSLHSIYYRAPTFIRENFQNSSFEDQLEKSQWAAFIRSLSVFRKAKWLNNPVNTYFAEIKPVQLTIANELGFKIPSTLIGNMSDTNLLASIPGKNLAIKTVDTGYVTGEKQDGFIYTNFIEKTSLNRENTNTIPFILQQALVPKIDVRVTVIGDILFAISIKSDKPIDEDWRLKKDSLKYDLIDLPKEVSNNCIRLLNELKLNFAGIDLVIYNDEYYFIEINPTGEWDWLMHHTGCKIDFAIANELISD